MKELYLMSQIVPVFQIEGNILKKTFLSKKSTQNFLVNNNII